MHPAKILALIMLIALTFGAGLEANRAHLAAIFKNYGLLGRALLANFVIVPIFGILFARAFALPDDVATGFLLMAIAPGVPFILAGVRKKGQSLSFAIALAAMLPLLSIFTLPLMASLVLPAGDSAQLPVGQFFQTLLLFQLIPLIVGMLVGWRFPAIAAKLTRPAELVFLLAVIAVLVFLAPVIGKSLVTVFGSREIVAAFILVCLSIATGWLLGGPPREDRGVLASATALRNIGLCMLVATTNFKGTEVVAAVLSYFLVQALLVAVFGAYLKRTAQEAKA